VYELEMSFLMIVQLRCYFLPRNATRKRGTCRRPASICLSDSLCHINVLYQNGLKYHQTSRQSSHILDFQAHAPLLS